MKFEHHHSSRSPGLQWLWLSSGRSADSANPMRTLVRNAVKVGVVGHVVVAIFAMSVACCGVAQETAGWAGAKVTKTDLLTGETNYGKSAYFFASVLTRAGCHVAKVEGERGKEVFVRRDGQRGKAYADIAHPVFSPDGSALGYAARGVGGWRFIINDQEGPIFGEVLPDTFVFSNDGKRHAYLARKAGRLVAVVDGVVQAEAGGDLVPWLQPPVFSTDGSSVGYLEGSRLRKKMRVVVNGKPGELFDWVGLQGPQFSPDGRRFSYAAHDLSTGDNWFYVIDGQQRNAFDALGVSFVFSPDGKRLVYAGRRTEQWFLVEDGQPEVPIEGIVDHSLTFSPDSRRLAYAVAKRDRRAYLVVDGKPGPVHDGGGASLLPGLSANRASMQTVYALGSASSVLFSPNSHRIAYLARSGRTQRVFVDDKAEERRNGVSGGWDGVKRRFQPFGLWGPPGRQILPGCGREERSRLRRPRILWVQSRRQAYRVHGLEGGQDGYCGGWSGTRGIQRGAGWSGVSV